MFNKELLLQSRLPQGDVEIPGIGTVKVRGLSRVEAMGVQSLNGIVAIERRMLALGVVEPKLTESEVRLWQEASPAGELEPVTDKISELSGMTDTSAKDAYKEFESVPDAEFRVLSRAEVVDDGEPATS